jgi:hypothetical protein
VNGYKFHTQSWSEGKKTYNSGVYVKGVIEGGEDDFYGVIKHVYELFYNQDKVVLFYCEWFDPSHRWTKMNKITNNVDIRVGKKYNVYDPFIMAHNVRQVYYVPYPPTQPRKRGWSVAIKTKPRGRIETEDPTDEIEQVDEISHVNDIIEVERVTSWLDEQVEGEHVDPAVLLTPNEDDNDEDHVGYEENNVEGDHDERDQVAESVFGL